MDKWTLGLSVTLIGMGMTFLVLSIICVAIIAFNKAMEWIARTKAIKAPEQAPMERAPRPTVANANPPPATIAYPAVSPRGTALLSEEAEVPAHVVAAIAAAVSVFTEQPVNIITIQWAGNPGKYANYEILAGSK